MISAPFLKDIGDVTKENSRNTNPKNKICCTRIPGTICLSFLGTRNSHKLLILKFKRKITKGSSGVNNCGLSTPLVFL